MKTKLVQTKDYLLLIDEEAEIKENTNTFKEGINGDWYWNSKYNFVSNNGDITAFDFKIIAYYPLTKEAKELDLPLLPNPFEKEIDETTFFKNLGHECFVKMKELNPSGGIKEFIRIAVEFGYKAAQSNKQFSLEDVKKAIEMAREQSEPYYGGGGLVLSEPIYENKYTEEEIIQSLSTQQLPKEFIPEYGADISNSPYTSNKYNKALKALKESSKIGCKLKTIINSEGKEELVGTYKY